MVRENMRRAWRCRTERPAGRGLPGAAPPPGAADRERAASAAQARALWALVDDPGGGVTRVRVVGAPPGLIAALREVGGETGPGGAT